VLLYKDVFKDLEQSKDSTFGLNLPFGVHHASGKLLEIFLDEKTTHVAVQARTGMGKTALMDTLITYLVDKYDPEAVKINMHDYTMVEGQFYYNKEKYAHHLIGIPPLQGIDSAVDLLKDVNRDVRERLKEMAECGYTNITEFNGAGLDKGTYPRVFVMFDGIDRAYGEASEEQRLILDDFVKSITRIGKHVGVHLFVFTNMEIPESISECFDLKATFADTGILSLDSKLYLVPFRTHGERSNR
jgi:hypothetical protein